MRKFFVRLVVISAILLALGRAFAVPLVTPLLPAFAWLIEAADNRFRVDSLAIAKRPTGTFIESKVMLAGVLMIGTVRILYPDRKIAFSPSALLGNVLQPLLFFMAAILAWPAASLREVLARLLLGVPVAALLLAVNYPFGLLGAMLDFREQFPQASVPLIVYWNDFLQTGGPLVLAATTSAWVVAGAQAMARRGTLAASPFASKRDSA